MRRAMPDGIRLPSACGVYQGDRDKVGIRDGIGLGHGERVPTDSLDGAPDVDDLNTAFQKFLGLLRQMVRDSGNRGFERLVDVD